MSFELENGADGAQAEPTDVLDYMVKNKIFGAYSSGNDYYISATAIEGGVIRAGDVFEANIKTG